MAVESGKIFSILAHELRSPIGVIQGYVRMLRMRRADDDQDLRMLTAMLDATGRISAVARQASELAMWQQGAPEGEPQPVALADIARRVEAAELPRPIVVQLGDHGAATVDTWQPDALSAAVAAVVMAAERHHPDATIGLRARRNGSGTLQVFIGDDALAASMDDSAIAAADSARAGERLFSGGGQGLSLILAASVFDRHGISVGLMEPSGIVVLRLPKDRGRL